MALRAGLSEKVNLVRRCGERKGVSHAGENCGSLLEGRNQIRSPSAWLAPTGVAIPGQAFSYEHTC